MPISSPKSLSIVSALTPPHPRFAHADGWLVILSEPRTPNVCVCRGDNVAGRSSPRTASLAYYGGGERWHQRCIAAARSRELCIRTEPPSHERAIILRELLG